MGDQMAVGDETAGIAWHGEAAARGQATADGKAAVDDAAARSDADGKKKRKHQNKPEIKTAGRSDPRS